MSPKPSLPPPLIKIIFTLGAFVLTSAAPTINHKHLLESKRNFENTLDNFLNAYYDELITKQSLDHGRSDDDDDDDRSNSPKRQIVDMYDQMQGDQPASEGAAGNVGTTTYAAGVDIRSDQFIKTRDRRKREDERLRKENWVEYLKSQILNHIGRSNSSLTKPPEDPPLTDFNITDIIPKIFNNTALDDDQIAEKIRSFYPSCETPQNQDQEIWKETEDIMNLYFDFDFNTDNKNSNIASATLRLYRLPQNGTNRFSAKKDDCDNVDSVEEDRLLRISVYWYTKLQKKRRGKVDVKRRLSDSKVVTESSRWVELSVKPATKAWNKSTTKNLGLAILVEDQEGKALKADKYFKGASCTVGVSTPKPIPTIIRDASSVQADELDRIHSLLGRNTTSTIHSDVLLLPTVDICYLEFPDNVDISHYNSARINACNLRKMHEENQRIAERERLERLATLQFPSSRHIRHHQHRQSKINEDAAGKLSDLESSLRSSISNKQILFTREQLEEFQRDRGLNR